MHVQEIYTLYGALAMLHEAKGETDTARSLIVSLESMVEDEDDERRLQRVKRRIERLDPMTRFRDTFKAILQSEPMPKCTR